jgi:hypothetical protein
MIMPRNKLSGLPGQGHIAVHFGIEVMGYIVEPNGFERFVGFIGIAGWLFVLSLLSAEFPARRRTLLAVGSVPILMLALVSLFLSFPIYVLPAIFVVLALANSRDFNRS